MRTSDDDATSRLSLPAQPHQIPPILAYVEELAQQLGFEPTACLQIRLALEEILTGVITHGYAEDPTGRLELACEPQGATLRLVIRERGLPFDPDRTSRYDPEALTADGSTAGLGCFLAGHAVDEITRRNHGREGREIVLVKRLPGQHVRQILDLEPPARGTPESEAAGPAVASFVVRPFTRDDALEVSRCAYRSYGYTYEDYIYYPEMVIEKNRSGELTSRVAISGQGRLLGHAAIKRALPGAVLGELGVLFVIPQSRSVGAAKQLLTTLFREAPELGLRGLFSRVVAGHIASQRLLEALGMRTCGLLIGVFPHDVEFKDLTDTIPQKMSAVSMWYPVGVPRRRRIHPPARHRAWVEQLYKSLDLPCEVAPGQELPARREGHGHLAVTRVPILNIAEIELTGLDAWTGREVAAALEQLRHQQVESVYVSLDLEDAGAPALAEELTAQGFFFSGILPEAIGGRDALVLQYLNNVDIDYDRIQLHDPVAQELLEYIRAQDDFNRGGTP